jgi:hypothetical protein
MQASQIVVGLLLASEVPSISYTSYYIPQYYSTHATVPDSIALRMATDHKTS